MKRIVSVQGIPNALVVASAFVLLALGVVACSVGESTPSPTASSEQPRTPILAPLAQSKPTPSLSPEVGAVTPGTLCAEGTRPAFIKDVVLAKSTTGDNLTPVDVTDTFAPTQDKFHVVVTLDRAPDGMKIQAEWYLLQAKGYQDNREIDASEQTVNGTRNFDFSLAPTSGPWPVGTYCVEIHVNGTLAASRKFQVVGATAPSGSPIVDVMLAEGADPNTFAPVNATRTFATTVPTIHCVVQIQDAAPGTQFKARWLLPSGEPQEYQLTTEGSRRLDFTLTPGSKPFIAGAYKVEIYVNGTLDRTETFTIQ